MSLPLLHAGRTNPGLSAALDLRFALDKSLTAYRGPTPSFSRASTGTYFNSSGVLTSASINTPRFDHTFNGTSWVSRGLLVEEQRTNICTYSEDMANSNWSKLRLIISSDIVSGPDGNATSDKLVETASSGTHLARQFFSGISSGAIVTFSSFFKAAERGTVAIVATDNVAKNYPVLFDLVNGLVLGNLTSYSAYAAPLSSSITNVGNGWYRCAVVVQLDAGVTTAGIVLALSNTSSTSFNGVYTGDGVSGIYQWGAQVEVGAFPTSYIPTTSASTTRSADVCQITGGDFSSFYNSSEGSIAAEFDRLYVPTTDGSSVYSIRDASNNNAIYTWVPTSTGQDQVEIYTSGSVAAFNLGTPAAVGVTTKIATGYKANDFAASKNGAAVLTDTSGAVPVSPTFMAIGGVSTLNGHIARLRYYNKRLPNATLQQLSELDPTLNLQFALNKTLTPVVGPTPSFSRASTGTYFNSSGVLTSAAINAPRFDHTYDGTSWISKGLLIEEQRTNVCLWSEDFNNAAWTDVAGRTIYLDAATAPDNNTTADRIILTGSGYSLQKRAYTTTGNHTFSVWLRASSPTVVCIRISNDAGSQSYVVNCNVTTSWQRFSVTGNWSSNPVNFYAGFDQRSVVGGPGASADFFTWGAQLESGAFSTSYIPTTTTSVVRSADVCQITGTSFGSMWNQGEGSVASEFDFLAAPADRVSPRVWYASDGAYTNGMWVQSGASDGFYVYQSGSSQAALTATALGAGVSTRIASTYKLNDFAASFNGASALTDTTGNVPTVNRMEIGFMSDVSGRIINGHIAKLIYYPARLTNTKLQQLST